MHPCYFKILFASNADKVVNTIPNNVTNHILTSSIFEKRGDITPITIPAKHSLDKSKKYPASFSLLVLSLSFRSSFTFLLFSKLLIFILSPFNFAFYELLRPLINHISISWRVPVVKYI